MENYKNVAIAIFSLTVVFGSPALAEPTLEDYGLLPQVQLMSVSPSGELIAFRHTTPDLDILSVISLTKGERINALDVSEVKPLDLNFVNNSQLFIKASEFRRVEGFLGKFEVSTGFIMDVHTSKLHQLLHPGDGVVYPGQTGLGRVVGISSDGKYLYMPAFYGKPTLVLGEWTAPPVALLRAKISSYGKTRRHEAGTHDTLDFFVDAEGHVLALEEFDEMKNEHIVLAIQDGKKVEIFKHETPYTTHSFVGITDDEQSLLMLDTNAKTGRRALYTVALSNGSIEGPVYERSDADIVFTYKDTNRKVFGIGYSGLMPSYKFFDAALQKRVEDIVASFPQHSVWIRDISPDKKHIIAYVEGFSAAGDYFLFSAGKDPVFLTTSYANISPEDIHPNGTITIAARDGLKIPTLLTIPKNNIESMKNLPTVVMPHGGPAGYDTIGFHYRAQAFAQQGYLVVQPQFRGSSGFGNEFQVAGHGEWGGKMQDDITDVLQSLVEKGIANPDRVCIVGGSYGGYAALAGGAFTPDLYKCVVSINGIGDLHSMRSWISSERGQSSRSLEYWDKQIGGDEYTKEVAQQRSPKYAAAAFKAPVLLIHAKNDEIVPISQSRQMRDALKKADKKVTYIELEGDDHHLSKGGTRLETLRAVVDFVKTHI